MTKVWHEIATIFIGLDAERKGVVAVICNRKGDNASKSALNLKQRVESTLPVENVINLDVQVKSNEESNDHFATMRQKIVNRLQILVNNSVEQDPEIKSRKKMVQEVYAESMAHFAILRDFDPASENNEAVRKVKELMIKGKNEKHGPILIRGSKSSGKTAIIKRY